MTSVLNRTVPSSKWWHCWHLASLSNADWDSARGSALVPAEQCSQQQAIECLSCCWVGGTAMLLSIQRHFPSGIWNPLVNHHCLHHHSISFMHDGWELAGLSWIELSWDWVGCCFAEPYVWLTVVDLLGSA